MEVLKEMPVGLLFMLKLLKLSGRSTIDSDTEAIQVECLLLQKNKKIFQSQLATDPARFAAQRCATALLTRNLTPWSRPYYGSITTWKSTHPNESQPLKSLLSLELKKIDKNTSLLKALTSKALFQGSAMSRNLPPGSRRFFQNTCGR